MSKVSKEQSTAWTTLISKNYADQAIWFLNGFWEDVEADAELVWKWVETFSQLDQELHSGGHFLDEFWSHKFLETLGETMTVVAMRDMLRKIDVDNDRRMSVIEYLIYRFNKTVQQALNAPQGENKQEIEEAQQKVAAAQQAVDEMVALLQKQKETAAAAKAAADDARAKEQVAVQAEAEATRTEEAATAAATEAKRLADAADAVAAPYRAAVAENEAALAELRKQEEAYEKRKKELEQASQTGGVVQRNKAANELEQLKAEDPLPLRKAKISQQATLRKMEKAAAPFNEASAKANAAAEASAAAAQEAAESAENARRERQIAESARAEAENTAALADEAAAEAEQSVVQAEEILQQAVDFLEAAKKKGGIAHGAIWWMERSIAEKKKYMPQRKR